jgi:hypothetical protein
VIGRLPKVKTHFSDRFSGRLGGLSRGQGLAIGTEAPDFLTCDDRRDDRGDGSGGK